MNNIGLEVVFWTALTTFKLGIKRNEIHFTTKILNNKCLIQEEIFFVIENMIFSVTKILVALLITLSTLNGTLT